MNAHTLTATYIDCDQDWSEGATKYWFTLSGFDYGTQTEYNQTVGVVEHGSESFVVDSDGAKIDYNDYLKRIVERECIVTDEIRKNASGV